MDVETQVAILTNDVAHFTTLFDKMDSAIEKIGEVSNSISKMLAVHEEKLNQHQSVDQELFSLLEKRREELQANIKDLHSRITTLSREMSNDLDETEQRIMAALSTGINDIKNALSDDREKTETARETLEARVKELEKWRWVTIGGTGIVALFAREILNFLFK